MTREAALTLIESRLRLLVPVDPELRAALDLLRPKTRPTTAQAKRKALIAQIVKNGKGRAMSVTRQENLLKETLGEDERRRLEALPYSPQFAYTGHGKDAERIRAMAAA